MLCVAMVMPQQQAPSNTPARFCKSAWCTTTSTSSVTLLLLLMTLLVSIGTVPQVSSFVIAPLTTVTTRTPSFYTKPPSLSLSSSLRRTVLFMSLKPAALPLMDSGKALARSGELLIELTTALNVYGGAMSAAGAQIRNAGDSVAQAAASCRFKTGTELVCDELRESATCLTEAATKLEQAAEEAEVDGNADLANRIEVAVEHLQSCGVALEAAGAGIMMRKSLAEIGASIATAGADLQLLSPLIGALDPEKTECMEAGQRMTFAAEKMVEAGNQLQGVQPKTTGKSWLKGGSS